VLLSGYDTPHDTFETQLISMHITSELLTDQIRECRRINACTEEFARTMIHMVNRTINRKHNKSLIWKEDIIAYIVECSTIVLWKLCNPDEIKNTYAFCTTYITNMFCHLIKTEKHNW
jgi:hypothetical protein